MLAFAIGNITNAARASYTWLLDIAIGAAASEVNIVENFSLVASSGSDNIVPQAVYMLPVNIPAGTRLSAQAQCSGINGTDRIFDIILYGAG